jgi:C-terminal processing protease CtpA/Prc
LFCNASLLFIPRPNSGLRRKQIERVILYREQNEKRSVRSQGYGLCVCGGKLNLDDNQLYAIVAWVLPGGSADKMSVRPMDKILQWNGHSLVNLTYEQVANVIANSGDQAELLIEPFIRE